MNKLSNEDRVRVVACLVEGNSLRATVRMTGIHRTTIVKLLVDLGAACSEYQDRTLRNLPCKLIQVDEIWSFVGAKEKNASAEQKAKGWGDIWTWVALDPVSKLVASWYVGERHAGAGYHFLSDLKDRLANRIQLTSDGDRAYLDAVDGAFGTEIDFAVLQKTYGHAPDGPQTRYSPAECTGARKEIIMGNPDPRHVSTLHVERQNLTMRMSIRRFTRPTNAHSKKVENHEAAIALHYMHYHFARVHQSIRVTPAMEAGVADHVWTIAEIVGLLEK